MYLLQHIYLLYTYISIEYRQLSIKKFQSTFISAGY